LWKNNISISTIQYKNICRSFHQQYADFKKVTRFTRLNNLILTYLDEKSIAEMSSNKTLFMQLKQRILPKHPKNGEKKFGRPNQIFVAKLSPSFKSSLA
jgi:hypothetical protein